MVYEVSLFPIRKVKISLNDLTCVYMHLLARLLHIFSIQDKVVTKERSRRRDRHDDVY